MVNPMAVARGAGKMAEMLSGQVGMSHRFVVSLDAGQYSLGTWTRASGLGVSWAKHLYRPGNSNAETILPGNITYSNITLSRAACSDSQTVQNWLRTTTVEPRAFSGSIDMIDFLFMPVVSWKLNEFFPISWKITDFDASGAKPAVETLELAHTGFLEDGVQTL